MHSFIYITAFQVNVLHFNYIILWGISQPIFLDNIVKIILQFILSIIGYLTILDNIRDIYTWCVVASISAHKRLFILLMLCLPDLCSENGTRAATVRLRLNKREGTFRSPLSLCGSPNLGLPHLFIYGQADYYYKTTALDYKNREQFWKLCLWCDKNHTKDVEEL